MSSPWKKKQPEVVADKVLKRVEVSKMARKLQDRLALAQFKTNRGWEDLTLDTIEPKVEEELRRKRPTSSGDFMSDSSSSTSNSDVPYSRSRVPLGSSPLKAPFFSDAVGSSRSSSGHRKRTYQNSFQHAGTSTGGSRKRIRSSPSGGRSLHTSFKNHPLAFSSPIKPRKQPHFTTSAGPDLSFSRGTSHIPDSLQSANYATASDDEDNTLPLHSFQIRSSPPRTPPSGRGRTDFKRWDNHKNGKSGQEGADLLLYLATSPSPANPRTRSKMMNPPQTPPPKNMALPSSMMTTPGTSGGGGGFFSIFGGPHTPSQTFDFADFINVTPSPAQGHWQRTPAAKTPLNVGRKRLTFEDIRSPNSREVPSTSKHGNLGMPLGGDLLP